MTALQELPGLQHAKSVAIRLYPVSSTLGIAEGIETGFHAVKSSAAMCGQQ